MGYLSASVDVLEEDILLCNKSHEIDEATLTDIGLKKSVNGWFFKDEETAVTSLGSSLTPDEDLIAFTPQTEFEKYVVEQFRKTSKRSLRIEKTLFILEKKVDVLKQKGIRSDSTTEDTDDSDDESTDEDSMETSGSE
ncbi:hypothetical protein LR48_Vigan10g168300 [Vigna angularis]|uniref:Uncharacterized protein n=1 Tax=Phaseolus angularis TaxID=3914 RepID=A0A0L9VL47_PHAAN|nr:hypothetical protein LR48_Vigan10g168300 [Vigna angularis]